MKKMTTKEFALQNMLSLIQQNSGYSGVIEDGAIYIPFILPIDLGVYNDIYPIIEGTPWIAKFCCKDGKETIRITSTQF